MKPIPITTIWLLALSAISCQVNDHLVDDFSQKRSPYCPPLSSPEGKVIQVEPGEAGGLGEIVASAEPGDTIQLADGTYELGGAELWFETPQVTLRSASGNRDAVVLEGNYQGSNVIGVTASDVTVADLTISRANDHGIQVMGAADSSITGTLIYNVAVIDAQASAIAIHPSTEGFFADSGEVACSTLQLTAAGRTQVTNELDICYTGGVVGNQVRDWTIRDNRVEGFWCPQGLAEHGIHLWRGSRDTVVERNVVVDNTRGVGLGLSDSGEARTYADDPCPGTSGYVGHYGGIVRNNFVFVSDPDLFASDDGDDCGICLASSCGTQVLHNSLANTAGGAAAIEWRFVTTDVDLINNLATGTLRARDGASAMLAGNLEEASLGLFVDGPVGDLHLKSSATLAIDQGVPVEPGLCDWDIDSDPRGESRDVGADEL